MKNLTKLRNVQVLIVVLTVIVATIYGILGLAVPEYWAQLITLFVGVLAASAIAAQTGSTPIKLTRQVLLEKLKSPVLWGSLIALLNYVKTLDFANGIQGTIKIVVLIFEGILIIIGAFNNPNNLKAYMG